MTHRNAMNWFEIPVSDLDLDRGTLVYLDAGASLDTVLTRVEAAGGRVTTPKMQLPGNIGCFARMADAEGNRVGLHAPR